MNLEWISRANSNYGEEVHRSRISGEWSNMIGYEMGSSPARVSTMAKTSLVENFKHERKDNMDINMATLFAREVLQRSCFLDNLKPSDKKPDLHKTPS